MNSHRDNVKDAIGKLIDDEHYDRYDITDAVFDALGITEDEQNAVDGYFMHYAGVKPVPTYESLFNIAKEYDINQLDFCLLPMNDEIRNAACVEEAMHLVMKEIARKDFPKTVKEDSDGN